MVLSPSSFATLSVRARMQLHAMHEAGKEMHAHGISMACNHHPRERREKKRSAKKRGWGEEAKIGIIWIMRGEREGEWRESVRRRERLSVSMCVCVCEKERESRTC